jgi:disulfide bond formation protein DsbB
VDGYAITDVLETVSAVLAIGVAAGTLVVLASWVTGRRALLAPLVELRSTVTFLIAAGATAGSLYFSEVANYVPCRLCWFQRIAMYPLVVVGLVGMLRNDRGARWYALPIAAVGAVISAWHHLIEWRPSLEGGTCSATGPSCADIWFRSFGFATLAFMALVGFVAIIVINLIPEPTEDPR